MRRQIFLMNVTVLVAISCVAVLPTAQAYVTMQIVPVVNATGNGDPYEPGFSSMTHHTFDLLAHVTGDPWGGEDDWCAAGLEAGLCLGTFFQGTLGGLVPPPPAVIEQSPATEFDCYYTCPGFELGSMGFASPPIETPTSLYAEWYDTVDTGDGTFPLVRATIILPEPLVATSVMPTSGRQVGAFDMIIGMASTGGYLFPFSFDAYAICRGDLNEDGVVGPADLEVLLASYGVDEDGDLDGDVDQADLAQLLAMYGIICP